MRRRLPLIVLAIAGVGLLSTATIQAQQAATNNSQADDSNAKPCIVVYGAVRSPARFELRREVRLAEVLAMAGGLTERVDRTIQVVHSGTQCFQAAPRDQIGRDAPSSGDLNICEVADLLRGEERANPYLHPGDIVIANEIGPIYVTGNVRKPQEIFRKEQLTLTQAIKLAGGTLPDSRTNKVHIYRAKEDRIGAVDISVDLNAIKKHHAKDPILQPYDIINVPSKHAFDGGDVRLRPQSLAERIIQ